MAMASAKAPATGVGLLRGDLGVSIKQRRPVTDLIVQRIPATLRLGVAAIVIGYVIGVSLGVLAAVFHRTWVDQFIRVLSVIGNAVPAFWLGLLLIIIFGVQLDLLPISGMRNITQRGPQSVGDALRYMIMPVSVLSLNTIAFISRFTRTQVLEVLQQDYIRSAYAKGLPTQMIWFRHALRNSLLPVATFFGPSIGTLLAGAVIIEQVFQWPGMGKLIIDSVYSRDYPLVMGSVVVASVMFISGVLAIRPFVCHCSIRAFAWSERGMLGGRDKSRPYRFCRWSGLGHGARAQDRLAWKAPMPQRHSRSFWRDAFAFHSARSPHRLLQSAFCSWRRLSARFRRLCWNAFSSWK